MYRSAHPARVRSSPRDGLHRGRRIVRRAVERVRQPQLRMKTWPPRWPGNREQTARVKCALRRRQLDRWKCFRKRPLDRVSSPGSKGSCLPRRCTCVPRARRWRAQILEAPSAPYANDLTVPSGSYRMARDLLMRQTAGRRTAPQVDERHRLEAEFKRFV